MLRKITYGIGGAFVLFVLLALTAPSPDPIQELQSDTQVQAVAEAESIHADPPASEADTQGQPVAKTDTPTVSTPITQQASGVSEQATPPFQYYTVTSVVDGDTIKINIGGTVETLRLIGINTPESVDPRKPVQCFGIEASNRAKELLSGKKVRIETDATQDTRDRYGRLLVYVYREDGLFFNKRMIEDGYAYEYTYDRPYQYQAEFKAAQRTAQHGDRGLWSPDTCNGQTERVSNPPTTSSGGRYYTSSHHNAKYYYPEACSAWKGLSEKYLKSFHSLQELLAVYSRTLSPQCE